MKSSKKALAFALAAAMVVTAVPVAPAEAASTAKLSAKSVTVAAGTAKKQSKTIKVTTPSTWKSVKVTAKPSSSSIAKASVSGKTVKITAVKKGTAKVTVTVTAKKSGKKVTKKLTATAKVVNAGLKVTAPTEVVVGSETKLTTKVCPSAAKTTFKSSDDTIATVDENGTVKAVKAGDVTITTTTDYGKSVESKIVVKKAILKDVKQTETNKLEATIEGDTSSLTANNFVITNTNSKANYAVKSVTVDATDKTKVTVETYVPMNDGKDYTVVLDGTTKTFTATDGKVTAIAISPATVAVPTPKDEAGKTNPNTITVTYTDANGIVVKSTDISKKDVPSDYSWLEVSTDATNNGYLSGAVLNLYKAGNTAKVKVVLHTGKYENGQETGNLTAEATVTGVDATTTVTGWNVKTVKAAVTSPATTSFKDVKETKVAVGDNIVTYIQKSNSDNTADKATGYVFESSDKDVMTVTSAADLKDATAVSVTAYKEGNAYIIVKKDNNVVTTVPVTIGAKRKAVSLSLNKNNFSFSSVTVDDATVEVAAKDQYGEDYAITADKVACSYAKDSSKKFDAEVSGSKIIIKVTKDNFKNDKGEFDGTFAYNVSYDNLKTTFVVAVKKADTANIANYDLVLSAATADAIIKKDATNTTITAKVYGYDKNGNIAKNDLSFTDFTLSKDGVDVKEDASGTLNKTTGKININDTKNGTQMATGTYVLNVVVTIKGKESKFSKTFTVTNSQPGVSVNRNKETGDSFDDCFEFKYDNEKQTDVKYFGSNGEPLSNTSGTYHVAYAMVTVQLGTAKVVIKTPIGLTVTIN